MTAAGIAPDTLRALVEAGANLNITTAADAPLALAKGRGYGEMVTILEKAGAKFGFHYSRACRDTLDHLSAYMIVICG